MSTDKFDIPVDRPAAPASLLSDSSVLKLTRGHSCVLCQQRKVRCDKQKPCANCVKANVECRVVPPQPARRRKKPQERDLIDRLKKYEALLSQHGVSFDPIAHQLRPSDQAVDLAELENELTALETSPSDGLGDATERTPRWFSYYKEYRSDSRQYRSDSRQDSSDEEYEALTIHHSFDAMFDNGDGFPFVVGGAACSVTNAHPSAMQIFQLWQTYILNVNPLLKLNHVPTLQADIIAASTNPAKMPKPLEALMFAIYLAAITSLTDEKVQATFDEDRSVLLKKYYNALQQALVNAGFMRSGEISVLQALVLYLLCIREYVDPRSLFCLLGVAMRIATRMGLHRDAAEYGVAPFETELRRRLWWQLVIFDKRTAELVGSTITGLSSTGGDCRLPLNINDTDLSPHANDAPAPYMGATEMMFALTRIEMMIASDSGGFGPKPPTASPGNAASIAGSSKPSTMRVQYAPAPDSPGMPDQAARTIESYSAYMEKTYLRHCDPQIPTHLFTLLMTRQQLHKLRVVHTLFRSSTLDQLDAGDRNSAMMDAILTVELDNQIHAEESLQGFKWYTCHQFPLPAFVFLAQDLLSRTTGRLCNRAWDAMVENHKRRQMTKKPRSPLHVALGTFVIRAWDAHAAAEAHRGRIVSSPEMIEVMRQMSPRARPPPNSATMFRRKSEVGVASAAYSASVQACRPGLSSSSSYGFTTTSPAAGWPSTVGRPLSPTLTATPPMMTSSGDAPSSLSDASPLMYPGASHDSLDGTTMGMDGIMMSGAIDTGAPSAMLNPTLPDVDYQNMDWSSLLSFGQVGMPGGPYNEGPPPGPHHDHQNHELHYYRHHWREEHGFRGL